MGDGGHHELLCSSGHQTSHGWWGSNLTINPLASLGNVPSSEVMLAEMIIFRPSMSVMHPCAGSRGAVPVMPGRA